QRSSEPLLGAGTTANEHVVAFDYVVPGLDLGAEQADVGDVVLRAGIRAAGQMHVERLVERDRCLEPFGEPERLALGVGQGELAAGVAGAGDEAAADRARTQVE